MGNMNKNSKKGKTMNEDKYFRVIEVTTVGRKNHLDRHTFRCEVIRSDKSDHTLRLIYISHYKNLSRKDENGTLRCHDFSHSAGCKKDTNIRTKDWDISMRLGWGEREDWFKIQEVK